MKIALDYCFSRSGLILVYSMQASFNAYTWIQAFKYKANIEKQKVLLQ